MDASIATSADARLNPELASQLGSLRGGMVEVAERQGMPTRFSAVPHPDSPAMVIVDEETGRSTTVGLHAYGAARRMLGDLFG